MNNMKRNRAPGNDPAAGRAGVVAALVWLLAGLGQPVDGLAGEDTSGMAWMAERPASTDELAELRGGFMLPGGLKLDFSLERLVAIDGVSRMSYSYHSSDTWSPGHWENGAPSSTLPSPQVLIQNSLDNRVISSINRLDITLSNLRAMSAHGVGQGFQPYDAALLR